MCFQLNNKLSVFDDLMRSIHKFYFFGGKNIRDRTILMTALLLSVYTVDGINCYLKVF
jgi:hypothetical protein